MPTINYVKLKENAYYFSSPEEVKKLLQTIKKNDNLQFIENNFEAIIKDFNWNKINGQYLQLFEECFNRYTVGK